MAINEMRRRIAEETSKTEAELEVLEAEKARREKARVEEEAEKVAAEATARAMEEVKKKLDAATPVGGSRVETRRRLFEGEPKHMKIDLDAEDSRSSKEEAPAANTHGREGPRKGLGAPVMDPIMTPTPS